MKPKKITVVLAVLDGWGVASPKLKGNPITPKNAPHYFKWVKQFPHTTLKASGEAVGLFKGQEGNSEAGHLNLGAGRVVKQDARYISDAIADGSFFKNNAFNQAVEHAKKNKSAFHLMGLISNKNSAHSNPQHLYAILTFLRNEGVQKVYLHLFTDGRDSGQYDAPDYLKKLEEHLRGGTEKIATVMGRLYGMDRNKNWERTKRAYEAIVMGKGQNVPSAEMALARAYNLHQTDEFITPSVIVDEKNKPVAMVKDNDVVVFFNLRSDRARQLTKAFVQPHFGGKDQSGFKRLKYPKNICFVVMTDFGPDLPGVLTAFPSRDVVNSLPQMLDGRPQLYVAESEKFAHVTYFFNGGYPEHGPSARWVKIASNRVKDFEFDPAMKSKELGTYIATALKQHEYDVIVANFANADMVGHTGNYGAAERAIRSIDAALTEIVKVVVRQRTVLIITGDHGNAEEMINLTTNEPDSEHSSNPVPFIMIASPKTLKRWQHGKKIRLKQGGSLCDVAPSMLKLLGIHAPPEMTGRPLF